MYSTMDCKALLRNYDGSHHEVQGLGFREFRGFNGVQGSGLRSKAGSGVESCGRVAESLHERLGLGKKRYLKG